LSGGGQTDFKMKKNNSEQNNKPEYCITYLTTYQILVIVYT